MGPCGMLHMRPGVKIQIVPPVNIPIPTKIGSKMGGEFTYPKMGSHWFWPTAMIVLCLKKATQRLRRSRRSRRRFGRLQQIQRALPRALRAQQRFVTALLASIRKAKGKRCGVGIRIQVPLEDVF